ncbi:hypothetical protein ACWDTI_25355 [Gordonia sp. NPDC003424]
MSQVRPATIAATPPSNPQRGRDERPRRRVIRRDELNDLPTIIGREAAVRFCNDVLDVPITSTRMRRGMERRELPVHKIAAMNGVSERALYDWIMGMQRPAISQGGAA